MNLGSRIKQNLTKPARWPVLLIPLGLALVILSIAADTFSVSPGFGIRQQRLLALGGFIGLAGVLMSGLPALNKAVTARLCAIYTWMHSGRTNRRVWLAAFAFAFLLFGLFTAFFYKRYDYIDDPPIRDSARGNVAFLFSANVLRQALFFLYQNFSDLPWYGIALYASLVFSLALILYLVITYDGPTWYKLLFGLGIISLYIPFWMRASYNYASSIPGGLAFIFLFNSWRKNPPGLGQAFLLGLLLAISFIFRRDGVKVGLLFIAPPTLALMFLQLLVKRTPFKRLAAYALSLVVFMAPYLLIQAFDEYQYREALTPAEQFHRTSNRSRSAYYGQPLLLSQILKDEDLLNANGWSQNDVIIAEYGIVLFDENKFAADRFWNIFNDEIGLTDEESRQGVGGAIYNVLHFGQLENFEWYNPGWIKFNENWPYWPYYAAMLTLTVLSIWRGRRFYDKLFAPAFLLYFYLISTYMLNYMRFPRHVAVPPMVLICLALFVCIELDFQKITSGWGRKLLLGFILSGMAISMVGLAKLDWETDQEIAVKRTAFVNLYADFAERLGEDAFVFVRPPLYLDYFVDPLGDQGPANHVSLLNISSAAYSPAFYKFIESYGLEYGYQVLPWMVDNSKAYFVSSQKFLVDRVRQFVLDTYGIQVEMRPVHVYNDGLVIYKLVGANNAVSRYEVTHSLLSELPSAVINAADPAYVYETEITLNGQTRHAIFAHPDSEIIYSVKAPAAARLTFGIGFTPDAWLGREVLGDGAEFSVFVESGAERELLFTRYIDPKNKPADRRWFDFDIGLEKWSGRDVKLIFVTQAGPQQDNTNDWVGWAEPQIGRMVYFDFSQKFYQASPPPQALEQVRVRRIRVNDQYQDGLFVHSPNALSYPVRIQPGSTLEFSVGLDPAAWSQGDGAQFKILVSSPGKRDRRVYLRYLNPAQNPEDRQWFAESVDLSDYSGQDVQITFSVSAGPAGDISYDWAYWIRPRLVSARPGK